MRDSASVQEMVDWFRRCYKDPADGVPYNSQEGGYQYVHGGPYDAQEVLEKHFPKSDPAFIEKAVEEIESDGLTDWVKEEDY